MRIHSDKLTAHDVYQASASLPGVYVLCCEPHGSRKRARAYEVALEGNSPYLTQYDRYSNAATWDEWGLFLRELFRRDPAAVCGGYNGLDDFLDQTRAMLVGELRYYGAERAKRRGRYAPWIVARPAA